MAGCCEPPSQPSDSSPRQNKHYEQACDVRLQLALELENAKDHTGDSTDAEQTAYSGGGRLSTKPRRVVWVLAALSLCTLVGLTMIGLALFYADNTKPILVSVNNQLKANGRALQDVIFTLMTSKMWGPAHGQQKSVTSGPITNGTITSATSIDVTDMRMTDRIADDIVIQKLGGSTYQPLTSSNKENRYYTEELPWTRRVCEENTLMIGCESGKRINIVSALYGRTKPMVCPGVGGYIHRTYCPNPSSLRLVRHLCQGRSVCSVYASNTVFGDPCINTYKYLEVSYICTGETVGHVDCPSWTPWYDGDDPTAAGDFETLSRLRMKHLGEICISPSATEARVKGTNVPAEQSGDRLSMLDPQLGLACRNEDQQDNRCEDYEVRFCCPY